ncbi:DNA-directed RNA polymerase subunit K [Ignisphaera sp. 4213-co]|uniref:DNA-directed RNA polymerase subunit Rpo6 n=1 Tax=Ignisphaera cupida TaxID=3050454 RepID=A0ABD4Z5M5_9CREN|nr:DNA-directed RNA polymerase subunit K [Ignisphaera sp. 4213-co]MDK6028419.1 DNA-directed RNA polymerase subunit K [Ignisphaera sp. 4213-co]
MKSLNEIKIGPKRLTKYEKARIISARALQLAAGAPPLIDVSMLESKDPVIIAYYELLAGVLPLLIKRVKPNGEYQLIPVRILSDVENMRIEKVKELATKIFGIEEREVMRYVI